MNSKPLIFAAFLALFTSAGYVSHAQSRVSDPGVSSHNYKHPNKAAAAPKARLVVESSNPALAARFATLDVGQSQTDPTPKYAAREVRLVVFVRQYRQRNAINPLISNRNYKTRSGVHATRPAQQEEWICGTM